ncbi:MAG: hypothetical protein HZA66_23900 [Rhodopseudomonas palustris]|uniref:Uncharacterized protein n=1 Tax=Rhodopseudomonas palustris TaxID=1076 RepID=A0A933S2J7_RHOPL|nr:hypothetical protein [Rhodopseudomonas palustris]
MILLQNFLLLFAVIVALSVFGWFIVAPFNGTRPFIALIAPWAGLVMLAFLSLFFYVMLKLPLAYAGLLAAAVCTALSIYMFWINGRPLPARRNLLLWLLSVGVLTAVETAMNTYMSYRLGGPAILYYDGTDHAGWAWTADWLRLYPVTHRPLDWMSANLDTYQWIPYFHFTLDPRFGTFVVISLLSLVTGLSGLFAHDLACALGLTVGILAMVGVFSRTKLFAVLLAVGLVTCHWFDYGRTGYFGKALDYPGIFAVAGLAFLAFRMRSEQRLFALVSMAMIVVAMSHMYPGPVLGLFVGLLGVSYLLARHLFQRVELGRGAGPDLHLETRDSLMLLSLGVLIAVAASGVIARPLALGYSNYDLTWTYVFARAADLEHQGARLSLFTEAQLLQLTWLMGAIWVALLVAAIVQRNAEATALIAGPMLLLLVLYLAGARSMVFQMIGTFYPLGLVGLISVAETAWLQPNAPRWRTRAAAVGGAALAALVIAAHLPRFIGALDRFEGPNTPVKYQFTKQEIDGLAKAIGSDPAMIDVVEAPQFGLALVVGLGPDVPLQWSDKAWQYFSGCKVGVDSCAHRPPEPKPAKYRIVSALDNVAPDQIVYRTRQFLLIRNEAAPN